MKKENLVLACSMGETSMFLVIWCLENLNHIYNMVVICSNTGQEENESIEFADKCEKHYGVKIHWIEAKVHHGKRKSSTYSIKTYDTLTRKNDWQQRDDTPFEEVIKKYNLPNHSRLHCTRELKMNPIKAFAKDYFTLEDFKWWLNQDENFERFPFTSVYLAKENYKDFKNTEAYSAFKKGYKVKYKLALGIRSDEFDRINPNAKELGIIYPLISKDMQPMTKKHINFWWSQQPFRLNLKGYQGNCITCYKKSNNKLMQIAKESPQSFRFFNKMEEKYGNVNGKIPEKILVEQYDEITGETYWVSRLETLPPEEYKNTIFRNFQTAKDILEKSWNFQGEIVDDHIETESCEIFSGCGDEE